MTLTPRVLLIEDEAGLRLTLSDRLSSEGYSVETASDGETGLARASTGGYDLIVLDVMLPRMNGFDVCREVRQRGVTTPIDPPCAATPCRTTLRPTPVPRICASIARRPR